MKRVLTVDDSKSMRSIITKALGDLDIEIIQAEDGQQGLDAVEQAEPDLILLDLTMPVMDGQTMLKELRARGKKTRVILLTAESGSAVIGPLLPLGFDDYIVKPFKADEVKSKVNRILFPQSKAAAVAAPAVDEARDEKTLLPAEGRAYVDVLVIDDMENVAKHFRSFMPEQVKVNHATDGQTSANLGRERLYRVILVDIDIPDVDTASLVRQLRALQPTATFIALVMRNVKNPLQIAKEMGLDGLLVKPFDPEQIKDFLAAYFESKDLVELQENLLTILAFQGSRDPIRYFSKVGKLIDEALEKVAAACFTSIIMDLSNLPRTTANVIDLLSSKIENAGTLGLELKLVTPAEIKAMLDGVVETSSVSMYTSVSDAVADRNRLESKKRK